MITKVCSKCGIEKELDGFIKQKTGKFGRRADCKDCYKQYYEANKEYFKQYREANKEYYKQYKKQYREANKEKIKQHYEANKEYYKQYNKQYYEANKEYYMQKHKQYYEANPEMYKIKKQRRRARKRALPNTLTKDEWNETLNHFNNACAITGNTENIHLEHFIPISWGHGGTTKENCYPLEGSLNISKGNKNPFIWIQDYPQYTENFEKLVSYLASQNDMSVEEFRDYVYWCEENKQELQEDYEQLAFHLEGLEGETLVNRWY